MNTKEAIEKRGHLSDCAVHNEPAYPVGRCDCGFLNRLIKSLEEYRNSLYQEKAIQIKQLNYTQVTEVINLLQRGEKFEQIWEETKTYFAAVYYNRSLFEMREREKKYFPKEATE